MTAEMLDAVLYATLKAATEGLRPFRYSFSGAGNPCARALVYEARRHDAGLPPHGAREVKHAMAAACGNAVGELLEAGCHKLGWDTQAPVIMNGAVRVTGTLDVIAPGFVLDWKLVGEKSWKRAVKAPSDKHVTQVNGYAHAKGEPSWVLAYLRATSIFKPGELEWRIYNGETDPIAAKALVGTWAEVDAHRKAKTLPERPEAFSPAGFPCGWCNFKTECWSEVSNGQ
jgi:hypothetical protein